uniref:ATP-dependent DNA helicase PIF1 n=1 Tax=Sipha flava TaxID=143950 RepID=A0A2S2Q831_9HEMI
MLLRNLDAKGGLCNGTRMVIVELRRLNFRARLLNATEHDDDIIIPRIPLTTTEDDGLPFKLRRLQFPVRLAFSVTINKSQGQTFDRVGIYLPSPVFSHGQLYVAFSRVRNAESVKVYIPTDADGVTKNVVFREVL